MMLQVMKMTTLFLSDDNRLEPVFQYSSILILRIRQQDDNLGTICSASLAEYCLQRNQISRAFFCLDVD